jgi:lipopolysaccharide transport system ATP-binding protein
MSGIAISVENLGKSYLVGHSIAQAGRYTALRDVLACNARNLARKTRDMLQGRAIVQGDEIEEFWALKDLSFDIRQGDRIGIIGRNGAGKSTLLKILSRITEPTTGRISITGRVASLLEVGTGFHPELTGRENIFLNGAILGMSRRDIQLKFDEIVDFAEVEQFLDTPVKRYSSGMYVRLAFAVAAHLQPDILIVDEVLAVGDAQFQKKCLGKMEDVSNLGRTVLFVSHNLPMISNLCQKGIVLDAGELAFQGSISEAVLTYYRIVSANGAYTRGRQFEGSTAALLGGELIGTGNSLDITIHDELTIRMRYRIKQAVSSLCVPNFHVFGPDGNYAFVSSAADVAAMPVGDYIADCKIPPALLNEGAYFVGLAVTRYDYEGAYVVEFFDRNALTFNVIDPMDARSNRYGYAGPVPGIVRPTLEWAIRRIGD